ncbi:MAG: hypothetical protein LYZ70_02925 [Nitrososphaerales archaeon]|nr:hypothetical protein [Nitrososphaerales archaeon]
MVKLTDGKRPSNIAVSLALGVTFAVALYIIPWPTVLLLAQPAYERSDNTVTTQTIYGAFQVRVIVVYQAEAVISAGNLITAQIGATIPDELLKSFNISVVTFHPDQAFEVPFSAQFPLNASSTPKFLAPAYIKLDKVTGGWYKQDQIAYFTSGRFNGTLDLLSNTTGGMELTIPTNTQVSGEDATFSFVGSLVGIALTLVLIAFVVFELGWKRENGSRHNKKQEKIDYYTG